MELTKTQIESHKQLNIVNATIEARAESNQLLNDQGLAMLSLVISHFIAEITQHPEKLVKEFAH